MLNISVCILAHNGHESVDQMLIKLAKFKGINIEVCIGNQESNKGATAYYKQVADEYKEISSELLWDFGFAVCKNRVIQMANNPWVLVIDTDELWQENLGDFPGGLPEAIERYPDHPVFKVKRGAREEIEKVLEGRMSWKAVGDENARFFNKNEMELRGLIHESPYHKRDGHIWAAWCKHTPPVAFVAHESKQRLDPKYLQKKELLYDHLIAKIVERPELRYGTDFRWWTNYWETVVKPRYKNTTFEEWDSIEA